MTVRRLPATSVAMTCTRRVNRPAVRMRGVPGLSVTVRARPRRKAFDASVTVTRFDLTCLRSSSVTESFARSLVVIFSLRPFSSARGRARARAR